MHPNHTDLRAPRKTGELLISEGLARKEDVDAALRIQQRETTASPRGAHHGPSRDFVRKANDEPFSTAPAVGARFTPQSGVETDVRTPPADGTGGGKKGERTIGGILCDLDLVSPVDLSRVLKKYRKQLRLGEILLREGVIDAGLLEEALYEQQVHLQPLGRILIRKNRIRMDQLYSALASQYNIAYLRAPDFRCPESQKRELIQIIGRNYAEENLIVPYCLEGTKLTLAVHLPEKMIRIHELQTVYAYLRMECVLVRPDVFEDLFLRLYGSPITGTVPDPPEPVHTGGFGDAPKPEGFSTEGAGGVDAASEAARFVNELIRHAIHAQATSVHIEQNRDGPALRWRIRGLLQVMKVPGGQERLPDRLDAAVAHIKTMAGLDPRETRVPQHGAFPVRLTAKEGKEEIDFDVRVATWPSFCGENATLRISDVKARCSGIDDLQHSVHLLNPLKKALDGAEGIVLFSGPAGSGRRTSLYAAASYIFRPERKIVAIEESFRRRRSGIVQTLVDKGVNLGADTLLRMSRHQEPDVILLANIRDPETAEAAFDTASTGPLILAAMNAEDAVDTLLRLRALGIEGNQIARRLKGILSQRRLRRICRACKEKYLPGPQERPELFDTDPFHLMFYRGRGCKSCGFTGYDGFTLISEFLPMDDVLAAALHRGEDAPEIRRLVARSGFKTMADDALLKLRQTTLQELAKSGLPLWKSAQTPDPQQEAVAFRPESPAASEPGGDEERTWSIGPLDNDAGRIDDMYRTYLRMKKENDRRTSSAEAGLFREFIAASVEYICRHYGCSRVRFRIEKHRGRTDITASPLDTAQNP